MGVRHQPLSRLSRRHILIGALAAACSELPRIAHAHQAGIVSPPQPAPGLALTLHDGSATVLHDALVGRVSAVQLMFTRCQATCPIQGGLFAQAAKQLGSRLPEAQFLSISIAPAQDDPATLRAWLARFGASPRWRAARPDKARLADLVSFLKSSKAGPDPHSAQVYFFNSAAALVLRSVEFPPAKEIVRTLESLAKQS